MGQSILPDRPTLLRNTRCPYCGEDLATAPSDRDHVIGRRFVPKGSLSKSWNLILCACRRCNTIKSDLEDDLSAISMQPDAWGTHAADDPALKESSVRKAAGSLSRRTGRPVAASQEQFQLAASPGPGMRFTVTFTSPPQMDPVRASELARLQMMALFYWLTYNPKQQSGRWWVGGFFPFPWLPRSDWGNATKAGFTSAVKDWDSWTCVCAAGGYFKAMLRRAPDIPCWAWALEWNRRVRLFGFLGEEDAALSVLNSLPPTEVAEFVDEKGSVWRHRQDTPLPDEEDRLFVL